MLIGNFYSVPNERWKYLPHRLSISVRDDYCLWVIKRKQSSLQILNECKIANALIEHGTQSTWPNSRHLGQVTKRRRRGQLSARLVHKKMRSDVTLSWRLAQQLLLRLWRRFWEHSQDRISAARVSDTRPSRCWSSPLPRNGCPAVP
jgi:hypothetical protein